jgi:hypothetical protein
MAEGTEAGDSVATLGSPSRDVLSVDSLLSSSAAGAGRAVDTGSPEGSPCTTTASSPVCSVTTSAGAEVHERCSEACDASGPEVLIEVLLASPSGLELGLCTRISMRSRARMGTPASFLSGNEMIMGDMAVVETAITDLRPGLSPGLGAVAAPRPPPNMLPRLWKRGKPGDPCGEPTGWVGE